MPPATSPQRPSQGQQQRRQAPPQQQQPEQRQLQKLEPVSVDALTQIDEVANSCRLTLSSQSGSISHAVTVARSMVQLKELITPQVMAEILPLMNSELGFLTDKDPSKPDRDGNAQQPYPESVVKDAFIVATLRGARPVGNEFNIIARRAYLTKNCYTRLIREFPGLRNLRFHYGVPKMSTGGAVVPCKAWWTLNGEPQSMECDIPVRLNAGMGADAALGKAERKLKARLYQQLTGSVQEEADVDVLDDEAPAGQGSQVVDSTANEVQQAADAEQAHADAEGPQVPPDEDAAPFEADQGDGDQAETQTVEQFLLQNIDQVKDEFNLTSCEQDIAFHLGKGNITADHAKYMRRMLAEKRQALQLPPVDSKGAQ